MSEFYSAETGRKLTFLLLFFFSPPAYHLAPDPGQFGVAALESQKWSVELLDCIAVVKIHNKHYLVKPPSHYVVNQSENQFMSLAVFSLSLL